MNEKRKKKEREKSGTASGTENKGEKWPFTFVTERE